MESNIRPKLHVEQAMEGTVSWDAHPSGESFDQTGVVYPHCEPRVLHLPDECKLCAEATWLQREREYLDICNTGHTNRTFICPADRDRPDLGYDRWMGNTRKP